MVQLRSLSLIAALLTTPLLQHCGSSDDQGAEKGESNVGGAYRGLLTGSAETGVLDLVISESSEQGLLITKAVTPGNVSGTISFVSGGGGKVTLTGSFDAATGKLTLTGTNGSGTYSLNGTSKGGSFEGDYSGPHGAGAFSLLPATSSDAVTLYCGSYTGSGAMGVWNLVVDAAGTATGSRCDANSCGLLAGRIDGSDVTLNDREAGADAHGTKTENRLSGTWTAHGVSGTWMLEPDACNIPAEAVEDGSDAGADASTDAGGEHETSPTLDTVVTGLTDTFALAADDAFVYFFTSGSIQRCPVSGCASGTGEKMVDSLAVPSGLATSGDALFWTHDFSQIDTCQVTADPGCTPQTFLNVGASSYPSQLTVKKERLYWISQEGDTRRVQVCPTSGCSTGYPKTVLDSASATLLQGVGTSGLVLTESDLFIQTFVGPILRFKLTGPESADPASGTMVANGPYASGGMALDGSSLLWGASVDGKVKKCEAPACATISDYLTDLASPSAISVSAAGLFIAERGTSNGQGGAVANTGAVRVVRK